MLGEALAAAVGDGSTPVTVVAPGAVAIPSMRRSLERRLGTGAVAAVRFVSSVGEAAVAAATDAAGAVGGPLLAATRRRLLSMVVAEEGADLLGPAAVASHPATIAALDAAYLEMRGCSQAARDAVGATVRGARVLYLYDAMRRRVVAGGWTDEVDAMAATATAAAGGAGAGPVVVCAPPSTRLSWAERRFLDAVDATVVDPPLPAHVAATRVVVAPDVEAEARLAVGELLAAAEHRVPFGKMAIGYSARDPYARLMGDLLDVAGVPWWGTGTETLASSIAGRTLLAALRLPAGGWSRLDVMDVLAGAPVVDVGVRARWERAARDANVVAGASTWPVRLRALGGDDAHELSVWFVSFVGAVDTATAGRTWSDRVQGAVGLLRWLLPGEVADQSMARVVDAAEGLAALDLVGGDPSPDAFVDALQSALDDSSVARANDDGNAAVTVAPLTDLVGVDVDVVIGVGMHEGAFPARRRDDPLLPDAVRRETNGEIETRRERRERERAAAAFVLAAAGEERVLCTARADQRGQRALEPSPWLRRAVDERTEWVEPPSFEAVVRSGVAMGEQEVALRGLATGALTASDAGIARGYDAIAARRSAAVTEWDGAVGAHPLLDLGGAGRVLSPTALEVWASCPFQFFLRSVLRVDETVRPEERIAIDARDRGTLVHEVLERVVAARLRGEPVDVERVTAEVCREFEDAGRVGRPLPWLLERRTVHAHLASVLAVDEADAGWSPTAVEVVFGNDRAGNDDDDGDVALPAVVIERAGSDRPPLAFRGRIDRVDVSADGAHVRVTDYKTGRSHAYRRDLEPRRGQERVADPTAGGTRLQLPIYALAAGLHPGAAVRADYWFVTDAAKGYPRVGVEVDGETLSRLREVVSDTAGAIEDGVFPPQPGDAVLDSWRQCRRCAYDDVCAADRGDAAERKSGDEAVVRFGRLRAGGAAGVVG